MTRIEAEETLRQFIRREPFHPFVVELFDGRAIAVEHPGVAVGGSGATYIAPSLDLLEFAWEEVRAIRLAAHEAAS